jgi:CRP-like cAMP-binding protein
MPRTATVVATTATQLLVLRTRDFDKILAAHQDLADEISRVAEERLARTGAG